MMVIISKSHYSENIMMVIIPKGHYSENVSTMTVIQRKNGWISKVSVGWRTTQVGFGYGWYKSKYQGRGLKGVMMAKQCTIIRYMPSCAKLIKGYLSALPEKLKILAKFKLN